jgi:hypothetical protein
MKKILTLCLLAVITAGTASAQLGGLLKKAKDKVSSSGSKKEAEKPAEVAPVKETTVVKETPAEAAKPAPAEVKAPVERIELWPEGNINRVKPSGEKLTMHGKYVGKLVFSAQKLTPESTKESLFKTNFNIDEAIYARVFIDEPIKNYITYSDNNTTQFSNGYGDCTLEYTIDGNKENVYILKRYSRKDDTQGWITWQYFICARGEDAEFNSEDFIKNMNALADGQHTITMELWAGGGSGRRGIKPIATGEIKLNKAPGKKMSLGRNWASYKAGMVNEALTKEFVELMKARAAKDGWKETFTKAKIMDKDWYVKKNDYTGEKLYRVITAWVYAKWPDGHCTVQEFSFSQDWNGTAFSKNTEQSGIGNQTTIDCD